DAGGTATSSFGGPTESAPAAADFPAIGTTYTGNIAPGEVFINWPRIDGPEDIKAALQQLAVVTRTRDARPRGQPIRPADPPGKTGRAPLRVCAAPARS
ncbi:MAG: hypothetical protein ACM3Q0_06695, partial [Bacteroidota bacterium]